MALILAIQSDPAQSGGLCDVLRESGGADVLVVDSVDRALTVLDSTIPDLILVDALASPGDMDHLLGYLRVLPDAGHVQTLSVPVIQLAVPTGGIPSQETQGWQERF